MMPKRLKRNFFTKPTLQIAQDMLGKFLIRKIGNKKLAGMIVETEAYIGPQDKASHAFNNKRTPRNQAEWLIGGHIYIYLVYGMYWQLNISTGKANSPECLLIRALEPTNGVELMKSFRNTKNVNKLTNGPGKLCDALKLDKSFYGEDITKSKRMWLEDRRNPPTGSDVTSRAGGLQIKKGPRIGIDYAGPVWSKKPWRFWIKNNSSVSV